MNKELTPMQQHISDIEEALKHDDLNLLTPEAVLKAAIEGAKKYLPKERKGYEDMFINGFQSSSPIDEPCSRQSASDYFTSKYISNE